MIVYILSRDPFYIGGQCSIDSVHSSFERILELYPEKTFVESKWKYKRWNNSGHDDAYLEITEWQIDPVWDEYEEGYVYPKK